MGRGEAWKGGWADVAQYAPHIMFSTELQKRVRNSGGKICHLHSLRISLKANRTKVEKMMFSVIHEGNSNSKPHMKSRVGSIIPLNLNVNEGRCEELQNFFLNLQQENYFPEIIFKKCT